MVIVEFEISAQTLTYFRRTKANTFTNSLANLGMRTLLVPIVRATLLKQPATLNI